ncbi:MAG: DUF3830 family protein [Armatimonadetes bacterium]|nr:DUF3830 family protein [Armatimonadota bacterium]
MSRFIGFIAEDEGFTARAEPWDGKAPLTCQLVWDMLSVTAYFHHAIYSGPEVAMVLPEYREMGQENATTVVLPWEIGFVSLKASDYTEVDADFSEICFLYDRGSVPSMAEGPVQVNLFAHFVSGQEELRALCFRMRREGQKRFTVRRVEG